MCRPVPCTICGKTTWAGCGDHVDAVRAQVSAADWCPGHLGAEGTGDASTGPSRSASRSASGSAGGHPGRQLRLFGR
jgi:hypothetical protein